MSIAATFKPLTEEQYNKAIAAGFTPDQIIANEKTRKASYTFTGANVPSAGFSNAGSKMDPTGAQSKAMIAGALPVAGSIAGGIVGGIGGAAVGSLGGPPGVVAGGYAGAVAGSGAGGAAGQAASNAITGAPVGQNVAKTGAEYAGLEAVGAPIASAVGKGLEATGAGIGKFFIPKTVEESAALQTYKAGTTFMQRMGAILGIGGKSAPTTAASTAFDKGIAGTEGMIGVKAERLQNTIWKGQVQPALDSSKKTIDMPSVFARAEQILKAGESELSRQGDLINALDAVKDAYKGVETKTLSEAQKIKEGFTKFVPSKLWKGQDVSGLLPNIKATLAGIIRSDIRSAVGPDVAKAYDDYSNLYALKELGVKAGAGGPVKVGGTFTGIHNIFQMLTVPIGTVGGQVLYKVGEGVEMLGPAGVKTVGALLGAGQSPSSPSAPTQAPPQAPTTPPTIPAQ